MSLEITILGEIPELSETLLTQNGDDDANLLEWQETEKLLNNKVTELETELSGEKSNAASLQHTIKLLEEERDTFKNQVQKLEKELTKNSLKGSRCEDIKDDTVTKAKSVIFEKTKMCKNQELQISALKQQVQSLKEIVAITKDMLDIRNLEVNQLQDKLDCMELKFTAEKDRHELMHTKLDKMIKLNAELKSEYQKQLELFTDLQNSYQQRQATTEKIEDIKKKN